MNDVASRNRAFDTWSSEHVDISVVTFNSARWLDRFIESLMGQSYPTQRMHLLFRDNGSTDETIEKIESLKRAYGESFASVRVDTGENIGFGRGHNANLACSTSRFFLVTNVDLIFEHDAIESVMHMAQHDDDQVVAAWELRQKPYEHPKAYNPVTLEVSWASSACILYRREPLELIRGYEPKLFLYGEDVEISYRLRDHGFKIRYCVNAVCWHYSYEVKNQIKPAQFFGSTVANVLIRMRYGTFRQIIVGIMMYFGLFFVPIPVEGRLKGLLRGGAKILLDGPRFLMSRKKSDAEFPFRGWDYETSREGAFIEYSALPLDPPLVTVIVRTCVGRLGKLQEAVRSVENQTYRNVELVIVEDGSNDAESFAAEVAARGMIKVVRYRSIEKGGRCVAGNIGLAMATGEFACFLDDDDLLFADHLELLASKLSSRPDLAGAYALAYQVDTHVISHQPWRYREVRKFVAYRERFSRPALWHHNYIAIQAILFRRQLYEQYGGFNEALDRLEDWDLWVRYSQRQDFELVEKVTSAYRVPANSAQALTRHQELHDYYAKALKAREHVIVCANPNQMMEYAAELATILYPVALSRSRMMRVARRLPAAWLLRSLYLRGRVAFAKAGRRLGGRR